MARSKQDVVVAVAFAALALVFLFEGRGLPFASRGIPGPGLFPFMLAVAILCFSAGLAVAALRRPRPAPPHVGPGDTELTPTAVADETGITAEDDAPRSLLRPLALWLLVLVVCVSLPYLGFLPAMIVLTLVLTVGMERRRDVASLVSAVAIPVAFYFLFATLLEVRLPGGLFG
jgi:hypothetical protein